MREPSGEDWEEFVGRLSFAPADADKPADLVRAVEEAEQEIGGDVRRIYHLAIPPPAFPGVVKMLGDTGLAERARIIVEKPFGTDLASARGARRDRRTQCSASRTSSRSTISSARSPSEHPGAAVRKRALRADLEPTPRRPRPDRRSRAADLAGRSGFYERCGAFRDMVVTHLFQVMGFIAMEPPTSFDREVPARRGCKSLRLDVSRSIPARVVRGQYEGYREEEGVAPDSDTDTFVALESGSTTGDGPASRSSCGPARRWRSAATVHARVPEPPRQMFKVAGDRPRRRARTSW